MTKKFARQYIRFEIDTQYRYASDIFKREATELLYDEFVKLCKDENFKKVPRTHLLSEFMIRNLIDGRRALWNEVNIRLEKKYGNRKH